jgi:cation:H+ antiporter
VIGLTVVAFGTSAPELAVSVKAALSQEPSIALGNVVGSNVLNVLLILGLSALVAPLLVSRKLVRIDVPIMIGASVIVTLLALDGALSRTDGVLLLVGLAAYMWLVFRKVRKEPISRRTDHIGQEKPVELRTGKWGNVVLLVGGLVMIILGARMLVDSAADIARSMGVSELVIGLTIVAGGTSLPEVVASVMASIRGERDIAVGNIIGSNLFNLTAVLGAASVAAPAGVTVAPSVVGFDLPIMILVAFACLPIFFTGGVISRWEGGLLLAYYLAYTLYLILAAAHHDALGSYSAVLLYFAIPLTLVTLFVLASLELSKNKNQEPRTKD